ncbi:hypothetical protein BV378_14310 [Nostoc sp. RF31YmG]|nr:hypothetical protein BV378_14310 [Nostoc sp. RF31YmG]
MRTEVDQLAELRRLADAWEQETLFESSTQQIIFNPNYQRIIGFGERALSFIFDELRSKGGYWFWALKMITGEDPVSPRDVGNYEAMRAAWLNWAAENGM